MRNPIPNHIYAKSLNDKRRALKYTTSRIKSSIDFSYDRAIDADLVEAILREDVTNVRRAIELGANVKAVENVTEGRSPIHYATLQTNPKIIEILKEHGADLHKLRSERELKGSFFHLPLAYRHPLMMCLSKRPLNKIIAKTLLKYMPDIKRQSWYPEVPNYHHIISKLNNENQTEVASEEEGMRYTTKEAFIESLRETNRLLYRLKSTLLHNAPLFATSINIGCILGWTNSPLIYFLPLTLTTLSVTAAYQYYSGYGFEDKKYYLDSDDIDKGLELIWHKGAEVLSLIFNARSYKDPHKYREYSYTPGETENRSGNISM